MYYRDFFLETKGDIDDYLREDFNRTLYNATFKELTMFGSNALDVFNDAYFFCSRIVYAYHPELHYASSYIYGWDGLGMSCDVMSYVYAILSLQSHLSDDVKLFLETIEQKMEMENYPEIWDAVCGFVSSRQNDGKYINTDFTANIVRRDQKKLIEQALFRYCHGDAYSDFRGVIDEMLGKDILFAKQIASLLNDEVYEYYMKELSQLVVNCKMFACSQPNLIHYIKKEYDDFLAWVKLDCWKNVLFERKIKYCCLYEHKEEQAFNAQISYIDECEIINTEDNDKIKASNQKRWLNSKLKTLTARQWVRLAIELGLKDKLGTVEAVNYFLSDLTGLSTSTFHNYWSSSHEDLTKLNDEEIKEMIEAWKAEETAEKIKLSKKKNKK